MQGQSIWLWVESVVFVRLPLAFSVFISQIYSHFFICTTWPETSFDISLLPRFRMKQQILANVTCKPLSSRFLSWIHFVQNFGKIWASISVIHCFWIFHIDVISFVTFWRDKFEPPLFNLVFISFYFSFTTTSHQYLAV